MKILHFTEYEALKAPSPSAIISPAPAPENLVYCISCRRCSHIYIGETGRSLRSRIGEHLRSVRNDPCNQHPVSCDTTLPLRRSQYSITDVQVRGMRLCRGPNILRKQLETRQIFQLGTVQPDGLKVNINFKYV